MFRGSDVGRRWRGGGKVGGGVIEKCFGGVEYVELEVFPALDEVCMIQSRGKMGGIG